MRACEIKPEMNDVEYAHVKRNDQRIFALHTHTTSLGIIFFILWSVNETANVVHLVNVYGLCNNNYLLLLLFGIV